MNKTDILSHIKIGIMEGIRSFEAGGAEASGFYDDYCAVTNGERKFTVRYELVFKDEDHIDSLRVVEAFYHLGNEDSFAFGSSLKRLRIDSVAKALGMDTVQELNCWLLDNYSDEILNGYWKSVYDETIL